MGARMGVCMGAPAGYCGGSAVPARRGAHREELLGHQGSGRDERKLEHALAVHGGEELEGDGEGAPAVEVALREVLGAVLVMQLLLHPASRLCTRQFRFPRQRENRPLDRERSDLACLPREQKETVVVLTERNKQKKDASAYGVQ